MGSAMSQIHMLAILAALAVGISVVAISETDGLAGFVVEPDVTIESGRCLRCGGT